MAAMEKLVILMPAGVVLLEFEVWASIMLEGGGEGPTANSAEVIKSRFEPGGRRGCKGPRGPPDDMGSLSEEGAIDKFGEIIFNY